MPIITSILSAIMPSIGELIDRIFPDKTAAAQAKMEFELKLQDQLNQIDLAQIEVNKTEAASSSVFVAGWRPAIGWTCAIAIFYQFILTPFIAYMVALLYMYHPEIKIPVVPKLETGELMALVSSMLGIAGMRSAEKIKGVS